MILGHADFPRRMSPMIPGTPLRKRVLDKGLCQEMKSLSVNWRTAVAKSAKVSGSI
jgi:hypothetical protein